MDLYLPKDELLFVPLGGSGEIGMNLNLYGYNDQWLMVDMGVSFGEDGLPGVDVVMPDPTFIEDRKDGLLGLVLTHAHEDHLGAVPYMWKRFRCPIYATPFAAEFLRAKLTETDFADQVPIHEIELGGRFGLGPFDIEMITMTHSILEPNALAIRTPKGLVVHTGDWKFDPDPQIGEAADVKKLEALGDEGVIALICDSTNVFSEGVTGSEAEVAKNLVEVIAKYPTGRIAIACFATNVARLQSIIEAAHENGRCVALAGRSLKRVTEAARKVGYLTGYPNLLSDEDSMEVPKDQVLLICTGSQGEPRAALSRIANGDHPTVQLDAGDTVIFSAREIPGNEKAIGHIQNRLIKRGIQVITARDEPIHVSGHPGRQDLARMYQLTRPKILIPVHGEPRHLRAQAALAEQCQVPESVVPHDGTIIRLEPGNAGIIGDAGAGILCLDGGRLLSRDSETFRNRNRIVWNGVVFVSVVLNQFGEMVGEPKITAPSLFDEPGDDVRLDLFAAEIGNRVDQLDDDEVLDDAAVILAIRQSMRRPIRQKLGKRPLIEVHLMRVQESA
ncbi:MAG: ribonuclease J [Pseudomonadota bacterium]